MVSTLPRLPILDAISKHDPATTAVVHCLSGRTFKYGQLLPDIAKAHERLLAAAGTNDLRGERIAFLVENSYDYVVTLLAIMAARAVALPLSPPFPAAELQYILSHSEALLLLHSAKYAAKAQEVLSTPFPEPSPNPPAKPHPRLVELSKHTAGGDSTAEAVEFGSSISDSADFEGAGMMLYTSGTTNRPKGVLLPETALTAQCLSLMKAWEYSPKDRLLHVLPLHHIHGTVNAILTPLFAGSSIEFLFPFNANTVWHRFAAPLVQKQQLSLQNGSISPSETEDKFKDMSSDTPITFFTVVPTVYTRLLSTHPALPAHLAAAASTAISPPNMRVSISGSAALPTPVKRAWRDLSRGNVLLERYGMTEVGMALSCGLDFADRVDGSVGWPLPGVEARLVDLETGQVIEQGEEVDAQGRERSGEIQLRGPTVFREYWRNPAATAKEFVDGEDGRGRWFKTGDVALRRSVPTAGLETSSSGAWAKGPMYFILGRQSADIIKSGGEKVSALEVERELLSLPQVAEAAVLAVPSGKWGQKVGAVVVLRDEHRAQGWRPMDMRRALRDRLAAYKIPQVLRVVDAIPRNAMGKVNKKTLVRDVFKDDFSGDEM